MYFRPISLISSIVFPIFVISSLRINVNYFRNQPSKMIKNYFKILKKSDINKHINYLLSFLFLAVLGNVIVYYFVSSIYVIYFIPFIPLALLQLEWYRFFDEDSSSDNRLNKKKWLSLAFTALYSLGIIFYMMDFYHLPKVLFKILSIVLVLGCIGFLLNKRLKKWEALEIFIKPLFVFVVLILGLFVSPSKTLTADLAPLYGTSIWVGLLWAMLIYFSVFLILDQRRKDFVSFKDCSEKIEDDEEPLLPNQEGIIIKKPPRLITNYFQENNDFTQPDFKIDKMAKDLEISENTLRILLKNTK